MVEKTAKLIARLYRSATHLQPGDFRAWALSEICRTNDFEGGAWISYDADSTMWARNALGSIPLERLLSGTAFPAGGGLQLQQDDGGLDDPTPSIAPAQDSELIRMSEALGRLSRSSLYAVKLADPSRRYYHWFIFQSNSQPAVELHTDGLHVLLYHAHDAGDLSYTAGAQRWENSSTRAAAYVTASGHVIATSLKFLELLRTHEAHLTGHRKLPFEAPGANEGAVPVTDSLFAESQVDGDYRLLQLWELSPLDRLSPRERAVAQRIAAGNSFKEVANTLNISVSSAATFCYRSYRKLGVVNRRELREFLASLDSDPTRGS